MKSFINEKLNPKNCFVMIMAGYIKKHFHELYLMDYQKMLMSVNYKETS